MRAKLTRTARRDLEDIRKHTKARWGLDQWLRYFAGLSAAFDRISSDPQSGHQRDTIHRGLRSLTFEQHLIFFNPTGHAGGAVVIVRIVHQSRNLVALSFTDDLAP